MVRYLLALAAGLVLLAGCSAAAPRHPPHAHPVATPAAYSDTQACAAFHQATTTGAPNGEDTMAWLLGQDGQASPALKAALERFAGAWADPVNVREIHRAQRAVKALCG